MSPLLGSTGGSSEYAYRGILDDWPNPFASSLSAQNTLGTLRPTDFATANLTVTGLNYKARVIVENDNATVSIDGRPFVSAKSSDPDAVFVRDNQTIQIRLQPTSGTKGDFGKSYTIPVKIGKRSGTWLVSTKLIDETPDNFIFNGLINQPLGIGTTSNSVTILNLEPGFSFPITASANQTGDGTSITIYKNGSSIGTSGTVANTDQIYLSTQTPNLYSTTRTFDVQVGTFTTTWGLITRNAVTSINPFSFVGVSSANLLNTPYISSPITISGADSGPANPSNPTTWPTDPTALLVKISGPNAFFEIRTGIGNTLRYTDPSAPTAPEYWQDGSNPLTRYAFNGDKIQVKINSSASYSSTVVGILTVSNQSGSYIVTTRPAPIDTVPGAFTFTDLSGATAADRGVVVTSAPITLNGMTTGATDFGTASIVVSGTTPGINPQFQVVRGGSVVKAFSSANSQVRNLDQITLRMTTPNVSGTDGVTTANLEFRVDGTDTTTNLPLEGYITTNAFANDTWSVTTKARTCGPIAPFSIPNQIDKPRSEVNYIVVGPFSGFENDCQIGVAVTSQSSNYNFTQLNGVGITSSKTLTNVSAGSTALLVVTTSPSYVTDVSSTITVSNSATGVTPVATSGTPPTTGFTTSFVLRTVGDTTPWVLSLSASPTTIDIGSSTTLTWSSVNCTEIRSVSWSINPPAASSVGSGSSVVTPATVGTFTYTIEAFVNPSSSTYTTGTTLDTVRGLRYATATTTTPVTVNEDYIPTLTPSTTIFSSVTGVVRSDAIARLYSSGTLTVTGITANISATVTGDADASFDSPFTPGTTSASTISSGTIIKLRVRASTSYLTTTKAFINFTDPLGNPVATTREFNLTTAECVPTQAPPVQWPVGSATNNVVLDYYTNAQFTGKNPTTLLITSYTSETFLKSRPPTGLTATGNPSAYYNSIYPPDPITGLSTSGYFQGTTTNITWAQLITAIWDSFTSKAQRPPAQFEIETILSSFKPSNYTGITAGLTPWMTDLNSSAISNANRIRDITTPIYNSCGPDRAATVGTIQPAGTSYPNVT